MAGGRAGVAHLRGPRLLNKAVKLSAVDLKAALKRELLESAGRKEIGMMTPLVFGILPLTVVFAIFPGISIMNLGLDSHNGL